MLPVTWITIRLFLHVTAAAVWVGGQLALAGLVPVLRRIDPEALRAVARRFGVIAWSAFAVVVATGTWNVVEVEPAWDQEYGRTLMAKLAVVAVSGVAAALHSVARTRAVLATFGALSALAALAVVFLAVQL